MFFKPACCQAANFQAVRLGLSSSAEYWAMGRFTGEFKFKTISQPSSAGFKVGFRYDLAIQPMVMPSMPEATVGGLLQVGLVCFRRAAF